MTDIHTLWFCGVEFFCSLSAVVQHMKTLDVRHLDWFCLCGESEVETLSSLPLIYFLSSILSETKSVFEKCKWFEFTFHDPFFLLLLFLWARDSKWIRKKTASIFYAHSNWKQVLSWCHFLKVDVLNGFCIFKNVFLSQQLMFLLYLYTDVRLWF